MAKQMSIIQFSGKLGETVGQRSAKGNQIIRRRAEKVSNPQTAAQAAQRMKLAPASNFYRALSGLLDHSFQGVKYGAMSHAKFNELAMRMTSGFPFVAKGDVTPYPGEYVIATGGLAPVIITDIADGMASTSLGLSVTFDDGDPVMPVTIGAMSQALLDENPTLKEGDQLTFVFCCVKNSVIFYHYGRFIIDTTSTATMEAWYKSQKVYFVYNDGLWIAPSDGDNELAPNIYGAAVIVSRPPRKAGGDWQRSMTTFKVSAEYKESLMSNNQYNFALATYMQKVSNVNSDWYLNEGNDGSAGNGANAGSTPVMQGGSVTIDGTQIDAAWLRHSGESRLIVDAVDGGFNVFEYLGDNQARRIATVYTSQNLIDADVPTNERVSLATAQAYLPTAEFLAASQGGGAINDEP